MIEYSIYVLAISVVGPTGFLVKDHGILSSVSAVRQYFKRHIVWIDPNPCQQYWWWSYDKPNISNIGQPTIYIRTKAIVTWGI